MATGQPVSQPRPEIPRPAKSMRSPDIRPKIGRKFPEQEEISVAPVSNDTLLYSHDGSLTIRGETIPVMVYAYEHLGNPSITVIAWKSKAVGLPVQIRYSLANVASVDVPLVETNIPGLLKVSTVAGS